MDTPARPLPRTDTEQVLLDLWSEILNTDRVGIHDDFLDLGGDSFAAMRCIIDLKATFGVELPLDVFFEEPASIATVAAELERMRSDASAARSRE
jgi:acyl carrier protein